ncbi:hypothetical protein Pelo_18300 [Pelomyxa schiedti]|nr:hypothetical protein Pelo_18300 [Pelomyxa schiedti]
MRPVCSVIRGHSKSSLTTHDSSNVSGHFREANSIHLSYSSRSRVICLRSHLTTTTHCCFAIFCYAENRMAFVTGYGSVCNSLRRFETETNPSSADPALHKLHQPLIVSANSGGAPISQISLASGGPTLGDTLSGQCSFELCKNRCQQISIFITSEEIVSTIHKSSNHYNQQPTPQRTEQEFSDVVTNTKITSFSMFIPPGAYHSFESDLVSLKWFANFHFVVNTNAKTLELLKFKVPFHVLPPLPLGG